MSSTKRMGYPVFFGLKRNIVDEKTGIISHKFIQMTVDVQTGLCVYGLIRELAGGDDIPDGARVFAYPDPGKEVWRAITKTANFVGSPVDLDYSDRFSVLELSPVAIPENLLRQARSKNVLMSEMIADIGKMMADIGDRPMRFDGWQRWNWSVPINSADDIDIKQILGDLVEDDEDTK